MFFCVFFFFTGMLTDTFIYLFIYYAYRPNTFRLAVKIAISVIDTESNTV